MYKIKLEEYEFINNNGVITVKRHENDWKDYIGDNAVLALLHKVEDLEEENNKLKNELNKAVECGINVFGKMIENLKDENFIKNVVDNLNSKGDNK